MQYAMSCATPMTSGCKITAYGSDLVQNPHFIGVLLVHCNTLPLLDLYYHTLTYVTITRPELSYSVNKVCQFMHNPLKSHWKIVKRLLRYLSGTMNYGLHLRRSNRLNVTGFCDADWGSDPDNRKLVPGYCIFLGSNLISWCSKN